MTKIIDSFRNFAKASKNNSLDFSLYYIPSINLVVKALRY